MNAHSASAAENEIETASQKPVKVELPQSIKQGTPSCKFLIQI